MSKLISVGEAAKLAGKSKDTIRRWIRTGTLTDRRKRGDKKSRVLVSLDDLKAHLAGQSQPPDPPVGDMHTGAQDDVHMHTQGEREPPVRHARGDPVVEAWKDQVSTLKGILEGARRDLDRKDADCDRLRQRVDDLLMKNAALEKELASVGRGDRTIRGLITGMLPGRRRRV